MLWDDATMVAAASIKLDELLILWLGSNGIYKSVMRIIDQQKELINKCASSNVPPPSTTNATAATTADGNVSNLPMLTSQRGRSRTLAVLRTPGKGGGGGNRGGCNNRSGVRLPLHPHQQQQPLLIILVVAKAVATCQEGHYSHHGVEGGG